MRVLEKEGTLGRVTQHSKLAGEEAIGQLGRDTSPLLDRIDRMVLNVQDFGRKNVGKLQTNHIQPLSTQQAPASTPIEADVKPKCRKDCSETPRQ